jgi:hypothetical protein
MSSRCLAHPPSATPAASASGATFDPASAGKNALRYELQGSVEKGDCRHADQDRHRHRACRVLHFAAWHERGLDSAESEQEQNAAARERADIWRIVDRQVGGIDREESAGDQQEQRQQFGDGECRIDTCAASDPEDVDRREECVDGDEHGRGGSR